MERTASLFRHATETLDRLDPRLLAPDLRQQLEELSQRGLEVFRLGVDAWRREDPAAVSEVDRLDNDVDRLRTGLLVRARELEKGAPELITLGLLGRYLERIADHGVAFAEHIAFVVTGQRTQDGD